MIKRVKIKNYKSLVDFDANFNDNDNLVVIYGENGSGKTNFLNAINGISKQMFSLKYIRFALRNFSDLLEDNKYYSKEEIQKTMSKNITLEDLLFKEITIGENIASIDLEMKIKGHDARYKLKYNKETLLEEELYYVIKKNTAKMYHFSSENIYISPQLLSSKEVLNELTSEIKQYWGKHSFLSILFNFLHTRNKEFWNNTINNNLLVFFEYFINITNKNLFNEDKGLYRNPSLKALGVSDINSDKISYTEDIDKKLHKLETSLFEYLSPLYKDIVDVQYKKEFDKENKTIEYELQLIKDIGNKKRTIPIHQESSGTQNIINLFPYIMSYLNGNIVLIDEIENSTHDLLIDEILSSLENFESKGQIIATTHNTMIMEKANQSHIYILNEMDGKKTIDPINKNSTTRFRETHNLRKRYLEGLYFGIPYTRSVDFLEIKEELDDE